MRPVAITLLMIGLIAVVARPQAHAIPPFKKEFQKLYVTEETDKEFAKEVKSNKTGCFLCHQGKKKKNLNPYGVELGKLLDKKKDAKDKKKIAEALEKVAKIHTDPKDKKSPTYGDRIKKNQFPGGPLEEVKKEPKKKEGDDKDAKDSEDDSKEEDDAKESDKNTDQKDAQETKDDNKQD